MASKNSLLQPNGQLHEPLASGQALSYGKLSLRPPRLFRARDVNRSQSSAFAPNGEKWFFKKPLYKLTIV